MNCETLRIGQVAASAEVNIQTLRYYERRGLLQEPQRTAAGHREYPAETVRLVRFIKRAQDLGFTLNEVEELLRLRRTTKRNRNEVQTLAATKAGEIDEKIRRLRSMRRALDQLVRSCRCGESDPECPILEALDDATSPKARGSAKRKRASRVDRKLQAKEPFVNGGSK